MGTDYSYIPKGEYGPSPIRGLIESVVGFNENEERWLIDRQAFAERLIVRGEVIGDLRPVAPHSRCSVYVWEPRSVGVRMLISSQDGHPWSVIYDWLEDDGVLTRWRPVAQVVREKEWPFAEHLG